jgi:hypothetical protein
MRTLIAIACLVVAMTSLLFLLISFVRVLGGKKVGGLRSAGALVLMIFVLWQSYLLEPVLTVSILYACVPAALAGALLILLSGIGEMNLARGSQAARPGHGCAPPANATR